MRAGADGGVLAGCGEADPTTSAVVGVGASEDHQHIEGEVVDAAAFLEGSAEQVLEPIGGTMQVPEGEHELVVRQVSSADI